MSAAAVARFQPAAAFAPAFMMRHTKRRQGAWLNARIAPDGSRESLSSTDDAQPATSTQLPESPLALLLRHIKAVPRRGSVTMKHNPSFAVRFKMYRSMA